jgi:lipoprotein-releasing system permease protein
MNSLVFRIAYRYLLGTHSEKNISVMVIISCIGIFIGTFALALVASIMNGFEKATHEKLQGIHSQVIMRSTSNEPLNFEKIAAVLGKEFPSVGDFAPTTFKQVIIQKKENNDLTNALLLKAIDPSLEEKVSNIGNTITGLPGLKAPLAFLLDGNQVVIGKKMAESLDITPGNEIRLLFTPEQKVRNKKIALDNYDVTVSGTFSTGIEEFDYGLILASFSLVKKIFPDAGVTQLSIRLAPGANEQATIAQLKNRFNIDVFSWKDLYPALVSALKLEKYAMLLILALIALVATMNIISLLFMQIIQKRPDIAIYQAMGLSGTNIMVIFLLMGMGICFVAGLCGLAAAYGAGLLLKKYPFISLPDTYYVSHLPIQMSWEIFLLVFIIVLIMGTLASLLPARSVKSIQIAKILRFEG